MQAPRSGTAVGSEKIVIAGTISGPKGGAKQNYQYAQPYWRCRLRHRHLPRAARPAEAEDPQELPERALGAVVVVAPGDPLLLRQVPSLPRFSRRLTDGAGARVAPRLCPITNLTPITPVWRQMACGRYGGTVPVVIHVAMSSITFASAWPGR